MYANNILPVLALITPSLSLPRQSSQANIGPVTGEWTMYGFNRDCTRLPNVCDYVFFLDQHTGPKDTAICHFSVNGHKQTDWTEKFCDGRFRVNGGWAERGNPDAFVTVAVKDTKLGAIGFFGFREDEFTHVGTKEPAMKRPAYKIPE